MKIKSKCILLLLVNLQITLFYAQNPEIKTELPTIIQPSPSVAALMKFEEVPVSNYTGVPDISIPLFNTGTLSKDINLDIKLRYHIGCIVADEEASFVGLGWSLSNGGSIARIVKDIPDDFYRAPVSGPVADNGKIGLYHNQQTFHKNNFYKLFENAQNNSIQNFTEYEKNEYLWEDYEKGKYDSEHDVWQYEFMGYSGRFTIIKNTTTNLLEVKNLTLDNNLLIKNYYNSSTFAPTFFEVFDSKGFKYVFDVSEETKTETFNDIFYYSFTYSGSNDYYATLPMRFMSAFHLSKVFDNNNNLIVDIAYNADNELIQEVRNNYTSQDNMAIEHSSPEDVLLAISSVDLGNGQFQNKKLKPKHTMISAKTTIATKKVKRIDVIGYSKFDFIYDNERLDFSQSNISSAKLKTIIKKNWYNQSLEKIDLDYFYNETNFSNKKKLYLKEIKRSSINNTISTKHELIYNFLETDNKLIGKDYWGYPNLVEPNENRYYFKEVSPNFSYNGLLKKIIYPTKSSVVFSFEPNTFSYIGNTELTSFNNNIYNWNDLTLTKNFNTTRNNTVDFFTINDAQDITFTGLITTIDHTYSDYRFNIFKVENNTQTLVGALDFSTSCNNSNSCFLKLFNLQPGQYKVSFSSVDLNFPTNFNAEITANFKEKNNLNLKYLFGGGNRIKKISYYKDANLLIETNNLPAPSKEINYNYNMFNNNQYSSGSLVNAIPQFEYIENEICHVEIVGIDNVIKFTGIYDVYYRIISSNSNNISSKTKGSDVGYENVTIYETNNGKTQQVFTSPRTYPENEDAYNTIFPYFPSENLDYKRGLLLSDEKFDENSRTLSKTSQVFEIIEADEPSKIFGFKTFLIGDNCPYVYKYTNYDQLFNYGMSSLFSCPIIPYLHFGLKVLKTSYGWAKLTSKTSKNYFYPNGGTIANIVQTDETYTYNPLNKKIASQTSTNSTTGEILTTNYFYHTGNSIYSQNRISEIERIETFRNSDLLSNSKINYSNTFANNVSFLPQTIEVQKGSNAPSTKVKYNSYDKFGNVLEVENEIGVKTAYIYGYNQTQPIAKIENAAYAAVQSQVDNLQTLSNSSPEDDLITALNTLRNSLPNNAMVTTYTYKPLIGISTVTDPNGFKTTYEYDDFNRLKKVKDKDGNTLSENEYNYRPN